MGAPRQGGVVPLGGRQGGSFLEGGRWASDRSFKPPRHPGSQPQGPPTPASRPRSVFLFLCIGLPRNQKNILEIKNVGELADRQTDRHTRALFGAAREGPTFCLGRGRVRGRGGEGGRRKAKGRPVRGSPRWFRPGAPAPAVAGVLDVRPELKWWEPLATSQRGTPVVYIYRQLLFR